MGEELTAGVTGHQVFAALQVDVELEKGVLAQSSVAQHGWVLHREKAKSRQAELITERVNIEKKGHGFRID